MELKVKILKWSAGIPVAMLREKTAEKIGIHTQERVFIHPIKDHKEYFTTIVDTVGKGFLKENEVALTSDVIERLGIKSGQKVDIKIAPSRRSLDFIKKKLSGKRLSKKEIKEIISDVVSNSISEPEVALFVSSMYKQGMNFKETTYLIDSILETGKKLDLKESLVDKHSIGGIAGNRTTPLVIPICAATGLKFSKTSSRAITSAAGTADVIESIARVDFTMREVKKIIQKTGACMVWGGGLGMVPADSKIIQIEKTLRIDPEAQLLASIMAKKLSMGSRYILIDIPYGDSAKVSKKKALHLKKKFEALGKHYKKKMKVVLTDGSQPIGNGIGPILELKDILKILKREGGPVDLEKKAVYLSGEILEMTGKSKKGQGEKLAREMLDSGKAFKKFKEIISAQGGAIKGLPNSKLKKDIFAQKKGRIVSIDNKKINSLARTAGCPADKASGVYLYVHKGYSVKKGEKLLTIHSELKSRLKDAEKLYKNIKPIDIK